jgi:hypothetical protein
MYLIKTLVSVGEGGRVVERIEWGSEKRGRRFSEPLWYFNNVCGYKRGGFWLDKVNFGESYEECSSIT